MLITQQSIRDVQVGLMLRFTSTSLPSPTDSLHKSRSYLKRQQAYGPLNKRLWAAPCLRTWSEDSCSSLLVMMGSLPQKIQTQAAGTRMIEMIKSAGLPVLWAVKGSTGSVSDRSTTELLKYLAMQALQLNSSGLADKVSPQFNATRVASASTEQDWLQVLGAGLSGVPKIYLVIDPEILGSSAHEQSELGGLISTLQEATFGNPGTVVKSVLISYRKTVVRRALQSSSPSCHRQLLSMDKFLRNNHSR
jgi:hypothetical protein